MTIRAGIREIAVNPWNTANSFLCDEALAVALLACSVVLVVFCTGVRQRAAANADARRHLRSGDARQFQRQLADRIDVDRRHPLPPAAPGAAAASTWMDVDAASGAERRCSTPAKMEAALAKTARGRRRAMRGGSRRSRGLTFNARVYRGARHDRRRSLLPTPSTDDRAVRLTTRSGRRRAGVVQPRRRAGRVRPRQQPVRRRRRERARTAADDGWRRRRFSTASSTGSTKKRSTGAANGTRVLVEPRFDTPGVPAHRRHAGAAYVTRRRHPLQQVVEPWD